ncbi:MAG: PTS fructose transporter subunit IIA [Acidobacteria bacterium]|uniref:PTS fructose transporter subunit IIA n=1 Tax=Candidatus Sulfomarinibacter kjeldsenii TaxID=2885994 RepID=A0A8J6Y628_9BACT|nr:PTS fructose transporter subunit IIA [Candidatus Sulfomarinibacter kjeldsenii]MBD3871230.1 PTS fructose transporter subunit IIA [Candidatus Sulfomarinibacter kjeldsenii]
MIPVLILTHGNLASELLQAAQTIDPSLSGHAASMSLPWDIDSDEASRSLKKQLRELDQGEGTLILTDMFGGTATNLALPFLEPEKVEIVTGVNLPMLVKLGSLQGRTMSLEELATGLTAAGQKSIRVASEFLHARASNAG